MNPIANTQEEHLTATLPLPVRILSLGAGVQSTTMLLMAMHGELPVKFDCAIFADTGWEPAAVYEHLDRLEAIVQQFPTPLEIFRVTAGNIYENTMRQVEEGRFSSNPPFFVLPFFARDGDVTSPLRRQCTKDYKLTPIRRKTRELVEARIDGKRLPEAAAEMLIGISLDEAMRMKPADVKWVKHRWPLIDMRMRRSDCVKWLAEHGYPEPPKSACVGCPYHSDAMWQEMQATGGPEWDSAVALDRAIRTMPGIRGEVFLHRLATPLEEIDFAALRRRKLGISEDQGQLFAEDGFGSECEGMCGV